jgi:hypothetical protein
MNKKGAEIALNVVIIAAIALLVLVVVVFIFGKRAGTFGQAVSSCEGLGGKCYENPCLTIGKPSIPNADCKEKNEDAPYCCSEAVGG